MREMRGQAAWRYRLWLLTKGETLLDPFQAKVVVAKPPVHAGFVACVPGIRHPELDGVPFNVYGLFFHGREIGPDEAVLFRCNDIGTGH
jgi:hypothetical protein